MTDGNGAEPIPAILAGHLVLHDDALGFTPDGTEDTIWRPIISMARDQLVELLSPGEGGMLAPVMNGQIPKVPKAFMKMGVPSKGPVSGRR